MTSFSDLGLSAPLLQALTAQGYETPTPIQAGAIPHLLAGRDVLGLAQTGTGKTAALALPILQHLSASGRPGGARPPVRARVQTPTPGRACPVHDTFPAYGAKLNLHFAVIHGGVSEKPQISAIRRGVDVLIATPGRLLDLMGQGHVRLDSVAFFVLDEADRMLDMGFMPAVRRVVGALPKARQTLLFSATMPDAIAELAAGLLKSDAARVEITPQATTVERIAQSVLFVETADKRKLLVDLFADAALARVLVFARTKHGANRVAEYLTKAGVKAEAIHGNKSQGARQRALDAFKSGRIRALVATDIAARGIDVDGVSHVVNYDLPNEPESYVHRIGRTARAGREGIALSFCDAEEIAYLRQIERTIRMAVPAADHPFHAAAIAAQRAQASRPSRLQRPAGARPRRAPQRPHRPHRRGMEGARTAAG
jgi:ATP-dependent RNA helicase RhlE